MYFGCIFVFVLDIVSSWPSTNSCRFSLLGLFKDNNELLSIHSRAMFKSAIIASQRLNISIGNNCIGYDSSVTNGDMIVALDKTCQSLRRSNLVGIVGPSVSREAHLISNFGEKLGLPVISYAATDPDLSDRNSYSTFYRTIPSDRTAAIAIAKLFVRFNWTSCAIIYQNDQFGTGALKVINEQFAQRNFLIRQTILFDINTKQIQGDLRSLFVNSGTRIVILWAESIYTSIILQNALEQNVLGPFYTWILSSSISFDDLNSSSYEKFIGMLTVEPVTASIVNANINSTLLNLAFDIWKEFELETFPLRNDDVDDYALFAFDATWTLIQALTNLSSIELTLTTDDCFHRQFNQSKNLLDRINEIDFVGVSGRVQFSTNETDRVNGSYYYARNIQYLTSTNQLQFIPVLQYSDLTDWKVSSSTSNFIVWPGNTLTIANDRAILKDVILNIGIIRSLPYVIVESDENNQTKLSGYIIELIEELQNKIGFIPKLHLQPTNQTYSNLIELVANGVYDIVIGDVTITAKRRELVAFSNSIYDNSLRILTRKSFDRSLDLFSYLKPFSIQLWLIICLTWICSSILFCLIERQENDSLENHRFLLWSFALSLWFSFGNIVGYGVDFHPRTFPGRLLTIALYILSLILVASYTANLASDLTIYKSKDFIDGIEDIRKGKIPSNRIGIRVGTASEDFYLREISGGIANYYPLTSRQEIYDRLFDETIDLTFVDVGTGEYITNNIYCNLTLIGTGFDEGAFGIVMQKQWIYTQDLDINILALRENGILNQLNQKWFQIKNCPDSTDTSTTTTAMTLQSMAGLFLTFAVLFILAFISFLFKYIRMKHRS